jgi:hypothetical protein
MNTERNWTSENRYNDSGSDAAGAGPNGIVPAWSVPPGLLNPARRITPPQPEPEPQPEPGPSDQSAHESRPWPEDRRWDENRPWNEDRPWPGVAEPARWFLRARAAAAPSPHREPDGSWSTAPAPAPQPEPDAGPPADGPARQALGATAARWGRAGGPGFQPGPAEAERASDDLSTWQRSQYTWEEAGVEWEPASALPLGAPVFADTEDEEDQQEAWLAEQEEQGEQDQQDKWGDDRPPIWERPASLMPPGRPGTDDSLLLDPAPRTDQRRRSPMGAGAWPGLVSRRTATIAVPAIVLVAVAVLALALLMGHGPKFGQLTGNQQGNQNAGGARSGLPVAALPAYPGQRQRGVFQTVNRIVASGATMVTIGSQTTDGVVRQQFFVSTDHGTSWRLAPVHGPGGGAAPLGHPASLVAGGPGGWLAIGPQAIWTSQDGTSWTLAEGHGISPRLPGDSVWVITKTAQGYLAAGAGGGQAVIWTSPDGLTWQRLTAARLGLPAAGETVQSISYATFHGDATVISGQVRRGGATYSGAWLSTSGGSAWTRVTIPADHGAGPVISGLAFDAAGLLAVRPGRSGGGAPEGVAYFSRNGQAWQYAGTIGVPGGWTPGVVKGADDGFVVTGTTVQGAIVAYTSTGTGGTWQPTGSLGEAAAESVVSATVARAGTVVAVGYTTATRLSQQPVLLEADTAGTVRPVPVINLPGGLIPELAVNGLAVAGGQTVAVGSANGYPAVWHKAAGGSWSLVTRLPLAASFPGLRALTSVTHGPAGWLAVGAPGPVLLTSPDGINWRPAGAAITQDLAGVAAVAAASGPVGYIIVGKLVAPGGGCVADVWWSPDLAVWTRAHDVNLATGSSQVLTVAAGARGFVSAGSHNGRPAVWTTTDGRAWRTIELPVPAGAATAVLQQIAITGHRVAALGQAITAGGGTMPLAELSADGGTTWHQVPFGAPGPGTVFTALTAGPRGFTATGQFAGPGQQQVAVWASADGTRWSQVRGPAGVSAITALAPSGPAVTGIGSVAGQQSHQIVTLALP